MNNVYKVAGPHIVHQNIDGEVIIVNLRDGFYFSLTETAATIWELLMKSQTLDEVVRSMHAQYQHENELIHKDVEALVQELLAEQLIEMMSAPAGAFQVPTESGKSYHKPVLHKFTDMEDVLTLDPIHDVAKTGWPNREPQA